MLSSTSHTKLATLHYTDCRLLSVFVSSLTLLLPLSSSPSLRFPLLFTCLIMIYLCKHFSQLHLANEQGRPAASSPHLLSHSTNPQLCVGATRIVASWPTRSLALPPSECVPWSVGLLFVYLS